MEYNRKGAWISLDGTDGVGKTALARYLQTVIRDSIVSPEFSDSPVGHFLKESVQTNPHFISESLIEQSLLFLADFFRIYDSVVNPSLGKGLCVISDRGLVSKYVYQLIVLSSRYNKTTVRGILESLFSLIPPPDLTILLTCEEQVQINRLLQRDGHCNDSRIEFIREANEEYLDYLVSHNLRFVRVHQTSEMNITTLFSEGEGIMKDFLNQERS